MSEPTTDPFFGIWQGYCDMKQRVQELNEENLALHRELAEVRLQLGQMTQQWESQRSIAKMATHELADLRQVRAP